MGEETFVAGTEVVEIPCAAGRGHKPVLGATPIAEGKDFAGFAREGQTIELILPESPLPGTFEKLGEGSITDIAEPIALMHKVIATKDISVVFDHGNIPACLPENAECMFPSYAPSDRLFEYLHGDAAYVTREPLIKDRAEEITKSLGRHRTIAYPACARVKFNER